MMAMKTGRGQELFKPGEKVKFSGEYALVDREGQVQEEYDFISLDEGDVFPSLPNENMCYMLNDTCLDEPCEVIGGPTEETE